ncbi:TetR family transcriptional regulator [Flavobacterium psychrophilum]|nr:TetR family transcriptional regulator [Flavobacterium psychrophilum]AOE52893.1 TetR family transcriptional regulator [Flavobacterium psychrophilum]
MRTRDADKEKLVIAKAIEQIVHDGLQGFSMNKLAKACNISVATLYIYYKDKDDLIIQIGSKIGEQFFTTAIKDFSSDMTFKEGLWKQWQNRAMFAIENPVEVKCFEAMKHTPYAEAIMKSGLLSQFKELLDGFTKNAIRNKQLVELPLDVFWSIAYGPLYTLLNFHREGKSLGGKPFTLSEEKMEQAFNQVIKALTP